MKKAMAERRNLGAEWWGLAVLVAGLGAASAQTPPGQKDPWKQTPEGRAAAPAQPMNCSGSITMGDGERVSTSDCPSLNASPASPALPVPAQRFPYPGENVPTATPEAPKSNSAPSQGAAKRFPYPGESPSEAGGAEASSNPDQKSAQQSRQGGGAGAATNPGESSSSAGSSSSSSAAPEANSSEVGGSTSSSSAPGQSASDSPFTDPDPDTAPAPKKGRRKLPPVPRQTPSERAEEDVRVAGFYLNDGNYRAAYGRAQDAVSLAGDDPEAHLTLAEAARKLGKLDEAQQQYKRCLELDPVPKLRKSAERALKEMSGGGA